MQQTTYERKGEIETPTRAHRQANNRTKNKLNVPPYDRDTIRYAWEEPRDGHMWGPRARWRKPPRAALGKRERGGRAEARAGRAAACTTEETI